MRASKQGQHLEIDVIAYARLYEARIHDEVFEIDTPSEFQPKHW